MIDKLRNAYVTAGVAVMGAGSLLLARGVSAATDFDDPATIAASVDGKIEAFVNAVWTYVLDYIGWGLAVVAIGLLLRFLYRMTRKF